VDIYTRAFEDEESLSGNKTQPYATTPMEVQNFMLS